MQSAWAEVSGIILSESYKQVLRCRKRAKACSHSYNPVFRSVRHVLRNDTNPEGLKSSGRWPSREGMFDHLKRSASYSAFSREEGWCAFNSSSFEISSSCARIVALYVDTCRKETTAIYYRSITWILSEAYLSGFWHGIYTHIWHCRSVHAESWNVSGKVSAIGEHEISHILFPDLL